MSFDIASIGTREDPHAQTRDARHLPLLLHSMSVFREMFEVIFASRKIGTVVEVGVESGKASSIYTDLGASDVYCVDPAPSDELRETLTRYPSLHLVEAPSPAVLGELPPADLYVLDGDHNYAVVHGELSWILKNAPDAVVAMHDVMWPCARRDLYYNGSPLPDDQRHESSGDGPTVWHDELTPAGFVGAGAFESAVQAGGDRNGVLTAVEDVLAEPENDGWRFLLVPAVFGMGLLLRAESAGADSIIAGLAPYTGSTLLATLENNRIALYTRILQLQYEAVGYHQAADSWAETATAQRHELERLNAELAGAEERRASDVAALQQEIDQLRHQLAQRLSTRVVAKVRRTINGE